MSNCRGCVNAGEDCNHCKRNPRRKKGVNRSSGRITPATDGDFYMTRMDIIRIKGMARAKGRYWRDSNHYGNIHKGNRRAIAHYTRREMKIIEKEEKK